MSKMVDLSEKPSTAYDSDSDMSDTERLIMERRRLNTEYMEQIEKERQELMEKILEEEKEHVIPDTPKETTTTTTTEDENDVEMKDVMNKSLEELEAERDALLQQVRNTEPPSVQQTPEATKAPEFELPTRINAENAEKRKKKPEKAVDINGEILRRTSESSTGESSPCSQVSIIVFFNNRAVKKTILIH